MIILINYQEGAKMINIIIENKKPELKDICPRLKNQPYPLNGIEIRFKNSKIRYPNNGSTIKIDGYNCYIDGEYYDLRKDIIDMITFKV